MSETKDIWDKLDILAKPMIAVVAAVALFLWNNERTQRQTAATMSQIAVSILGNKVENGANDPLREWAIEVLRQPSSPPPLSNEAAIRLKLEPLLLRSDGGWLNWLSANDAEAIDEMRSATKSIRESVERLRSIESSTPETDPTTEEAR